MELEAEGAPHDGAPFFFWGDKPRFFAIVLAIRRGEFFLNSAPKKAPPHCGIGGPFSQPAEILSIGHVESRLHLN
jgi:hypothetical protein